MEVCCSSIYYFIKDHIVILVLIAMLGKINERKYTRKLSLKKPRHMTTCGTQLSDSYVKKEKYTASCVCIGLKRFWNGLPRPKTL